jgi:outer membrane lipoprotein SlyB
LLGFTVGAVEGAAVGLLDGAAVGAWLGEAVGDAEGETDGFRVRICSTWREEDMGYIKTEKSELTFL